MPDDHSEVVPLLPIPNRTVKRLCADDSADPRVKVGHRQALIPAQNPQHLIVLGVLLCGARNSKVKDRAVYFL
jgi:hypothetical protein